MVQAPGPGGHWIVPVYIGEHPRGMIVDTGSTGNVLYSSALAEEGLHETGNYQFSQISGGFTGVSRHGVADVPLLKFAGIPLTDVTMSVTGAEPPKFDLLPIAGLLGTPYFSAFDIEIDVPGEKLSLYARATCADVAPPWSGPYSTLPLIAVSDNLRLRAQDVEGHSTVAVRGLGAANQAKLLVDVVVNGRPERALLDSGATTIIPPETSDALGIARQPDAKTITIHGLDGGSADGDIRRASELRLGDEVYRDKSVGVFPMHSVDADMVLGREVFRGKRLFISFVQKKLFVQPSDSKP